jgi:nucleotide-binding universal stress UspA family protein
MPLFHRILVGADFSGQSVKAFNIACSLAGEGETGLIVLHVLEATHVVERALALHPTGAPIFEAPGEQEPAIKKHLCDTYVPDRALEVSYRVREGSPAAEILRAAEEGLCDLIVLGTHGRTGLTRLLAGSVAEAVLREARCPVLALRSLEQPRDAQQIQVILHPTDLWEPSEAALGVARSLARDHGARLVVLYVAPIQVLINETTAVGTDPQAYRDALERIRGRLDGPDLKYPVDSRLETGDAAAEILRVAKELRCGLIVMGTHGRAGLGRLLLGSAVEAVLRGAHCPVLAVKAPVSSAATVASPPESATV